MIVAALKRRSVVAVIGSGVMGAGIAQIAAVAGYKVKLFDINPTTVDAAIFKIRQSLSKLVEKGLMKKDEADDACSMLVPIASLSEVADASIVIETIVENLDVKRALFADLETVVGRDCILATNTSSISITAIAAKLFRPERVVGMHFFFPVPLMGLVEVISGLATSSGVANVVSATALAWGKCPVHAKSTPGFIVNRAARPYYAEALRLLNEQTASPVTLDAIMRDLGEFRMGPFELMDFIGHDVNFSVTESVFNNYFGDPRFTPSVMQNELVNAGYLGQKSGRGFYDYSECEVIPEAHSEPDQTEALLGDIYISENILCAVSRCLAQRLIGAGVAVSRRTSSSEIASPETPLLYCNGAAVMLTDGRTATERAYANGHSDTVLFDLALNYAKSSRIVLSRADQCAPEAYNSVVGLFQAAGFIVTRIDDVPGMAVMRTISMLVNEASDLVNQGVCTALSVDIALQKGVNYPLGPLAWADNVGISCIVKVLTNLVHIYGEDRYRVSPLLRRKQANGSPFHPVSI